MFEEFFIWVSGLESSGYTVPMTIIYALLVILGLYILYRWIKKTGLPVNSAFVLSSCIYVILGGLLHVLDDMAAGGAYLIQYPWRLLFTTPQVYILVLIFGLLVLFVSYTLEKKKLIATYIKPYCACGTAACLAVLGILIWFGLTYTTFDVGIIVIVVGIAAGATLLLWAFLRFVCRWKYVSHPVYIALMASHFLDASATGFALDLHTKVYYEQHVLGDWLISLTGSGYSMFLLKLAVLIPGIWILEKFRQEKDFSILWYLVICVMIVVGLGPAVRDLFRMVLWI
ncbi:MAG TPA: DUF63 family protein [Methanocorpusculum sp.]|nr:DUF63 family protein [Methanocorpusculum sp.]